MSARSGESKTDAAGVVGLTQRSRHATGATTVRAPSSPPRPITIEYALTLGVCPRDVLVLAIER
jgi:hypothetical protein